MAPPENRSRKKLCNFCTDNVVNVDFADALRLKRYVTDRGKILPRRITGTCAKHQRLLSSRIKTSRQSGLIAYVSSN